MTWRHHIACRDADTNLFFTDATIPAAVGICLTCPVRKECLGDALTEEQDYADSHRAGVRGALTPQQRSLVVRRKLVACTRCHDAYDPALLLRGVAACSCGAVRTTPVADAQEHPWMPRYTELARRILIDILRYTPGDEVTKPTPLARNIGVRKEDVVRIYATLVGDAILLKEGRNYLRGHVTLVSPNEWKPLHERMPSC